MLPPFDRALERSLMNVVIAASELSKKAFASATKAGIDSKHAEATASSVSKEAQASLSSASRSASSAMSAASKSASSRIHAEL